ncbi:hypothetical protein [uncultured Corynebacterium sp.]|uniref:hypothetical protein n=1 Tax=uncultured Corynebacterium sp. TaxID=159447 RepID=UPI0025FA9213|nr:hypothetical protein [uncultured Corynebacterium sp.]
MTTHITLDEAALKRRMAHLSDEAHQLHSHAQAISGLPMPASSNVGMFPLTARRWLTSFSDTTGAHAKSLRDCAQQVVDFARTAREQDINSASGLHPGGSR